MPRGSASGKRQQGASSSHARHDNGLVAPGKKVSRGRNTNGHVDGKPANANPTVNNKSLDPSSTTTAVPTPSQHTVTPASSAPGNGSAAASSPAANGIHYKSSNGSVANGIKAHDDSNMAVDRRAHLPRRSSLGNDSETSTSTDSLPSRQHHQASRLRHEDHDDNMNSMAVSEPRQIDVNASKYATDVHKDSGPFDYAATVLMALPLHDTLAILLILMHVSPLTLSVIYTVFTVLTFATPITVNSVVNIHLAELLDWQSTMPSLVTVACVDILAILVFLFLWPSVQSAILDLAKPVIAATLGGGSASRRGGGGQSRTVSACFAFVIGTHVFKNTRGHWTRFLRLLPPSWRITPDADDPMEDVSRGAAAVVGRHGSPWYFTLLGVHILMQGIVRYIREWYIRRERSTAAAAAASSTSGDPEAGRPVSTISDPSDVAPQRPDTELAITHGSSTLSSNKKRRRQGAQVRLQQPLWAALASTKVVMIKEYELSHAASESAIADATDIHNLGNALFDREAGKIWISYVGCDEVSFDTSYFSHDDDDDDDDCSEPSSPTSPYSNGDPFSAVDRTKPFYIKINNAHWLSARIVPARARGNGEEDGQEEDDDALEGQSHRGTKWTGDIYGLRPMSKYVVEFVDARTEEVLFRSTITTTRERTRSSTMTSTTAGAAASNAAAGTSNGLPNGQRRAHSPASTLRTSIAASDAKLASEKGKLKTLRKEWKAKVNSLRKENDGTDHAIGSAGGTDDRFRQKIRQQETQRSQAEKETQELTLEIKAFDEAPTDVPARKEEAQRRWQAEKALFEAGQRELKRHSSAVTGAVKAREGERQTLQTRRNKIAGRVAKADTELANVADANRRGLNEAERRRLEREAWQRRVSAAEIKMNGDFNSLQMDNSILQDQHGSAVQQATALHSQITFGGVGKGGAGGLPSPSQFAAGGWNGVSGAPPTSVPAHAGGYAAWPVSGEQHSAGLSSIAPVPVTGPSSGPLWAFPSLGTGSTPSLPGPTTHAHPQLSAITHGSPNPPNPPPGFRLRGRSSSMLSDVSGFTHLSGDDDAALGPVGTPAGGGGATISVYRQGGMRSTPLRGPKRRKGSVGASSGSGSGSASHPASPL